MSKPEPPCKPRAATPCALTGSDPSSAWMSPATIKRVSSTALGFSATGDGDTLEVAVPSWRRDVQGEADLVEEVARVSSLTHLEPQPLPRLTAGVPAPVLTPMQLRERAARRTAAALGYNECVSYSFIDQAAAQLFGGGTDDGEAGKPDQFGNVPHAPCAAARPAASCRPQPGARNDRSGTVRGRGRLPWRRTGGTAPDGLGPSGRPYRPARSPRSHAAPSMSTT